MTTPEKMIGKQEYEHYAKAENQTPKGPACRRKQNLTEMVPVRFEADVLEEVRRRADAGRAQHGRSLVPTRRTTNSRRVSSLPSEGPPRCG